MPRFLLITLLLAGINTAVAAELKPIKLDPTYDHDRWGTSSEGTLKAFRAYTSSFDHADDDDDFGGADTWGVPEWVAYEIKRFDHNCITTHDRPSKWITDETLGAGVMPTHESYAYSQDFRRAHKAWFVRGHLAMKLHAERHDDDGVAAWNTHTFYNAVPQRQNFNAGIWLDMENLTAAWAQRFGSVWIVTGPVFVDQYPYGYIGEIDKGEPLAAVPEALFKIVVKDSGNPDRPDVLAFLYPQIGPGYTDADLYEHTRFLTSVDEIEELTGIDFLTNLPDPDERAIERTIATEIWQSADEDFIESCRSN